MISTLGKISGERITSLIPHREPFLLVDSVEVASEGHFIGSKFIGFNEPFFKGHFPDVPIMPGVLQIESAAQTACAGLAFMKRHLEERNLKGSLFVQNYDVRLGSISRVRFYKPVYPGCILKTEVKLEKEMRGIYAFVGAGKVEEEIVCEFEFKAAIFYPERTLSIIKPDAVENSNEIIEILRANGLLIQNISNNGHITPLRKRIKIERSIAEKFYAEHASRPFFNELCDYMCSGESVVMVLQGTDAISRYRKLMGATDPRKAEEGTLRQMFGKGIEANAVHGSDSAESAKREIEMLFPSLTA